MMSRKVQNAQAIFIYLFNERATFKTNETERKIY
jgi:hypothetical protein